MTVDPLDSLNLGPGPEASAPGTPASLPPTSARSKPAPAFSLQRLGRNPKLLIGGLIFLGLALIYMGVLVWQKLSPALGAAEETPVATATSEPALPTATALPAVIAPTALPTLSSLQLTLDGPGTYQSAQPYVAEYRLEMPRGNGIKGSLTCQGCFWPGGQAPVIDLPGPSSATTFRVAVTPPTPAHFSLSIAGQECLSWDLKPGTQEAAFHGTCAPVP